MLDDTPALDLGASPATFQRLYRHIHRARAKVLDACEQLPDGAFTKEQGLGYSSMRNIFVHCIDCEQGWVGFVAQQEGLVTRERAEATGQKYDEYDLYPDVPTVRAFAAKVEAGIMAFLDGLQPEGLARTRRHTWSNDPAKAVVRRTDQILMHVALHDTHHRGQLCALLRLSGVTPPPVDFMVPGL